jgi:hypothetical protein
MYQILCVLVATIAYGTAIGHCQGSQAGIAAITFQSSTYSDMRQLLAREAATEAVTVKANLGFPEQARDRYPAVIIVHTIAGYRDANEGYAAAELRKAGFATWSERPLRVKSAVLTLGRLLPVCPYQRTSSNRPGWSGWCQNRKSSREFQRGG